MLVLQNRETRFGFARMNVGDEIEMPTYDILACRSSVQHFSNKTGWKFKVWKDKEHGVGRCKRVA